MHTYSYIAVLLPHNVYGCNQCIIDVFHEIFKSMQFVPQSCELLTLEHALGMMRIHFSEPN
jgi:hypothetical protein